MVAKKHFLSIQVRLALIVLLSLIVIVTSGLTLVKYRDIERLKKQLVHEANAYGSLLSEDIVALATSGDITVADSVTQRLKQLELVEAVTVFNKQSTPVYNYNVASNPEYLLISDDWQQSHEFLENALALTMPVQVNGAMFALLQMQLSTKDISEYCRSVIQQVSIIIASVIFSSLLLTLLIQRLLTEPIIKLTKALRCTEKVRDYSLHLPVTRDDEIGELFTGFNNMQEAIQNANAGQVEIQYALDQHALVAITDVSGAITYVNNKFVELSGYSRDELLGQNHRMLNSGMHEEAFFNDMYHNIASGNVWHGEICNRAKDGHLYWVDTTIVPLMDKEGMPRRYIAIRSDITDQKQTEHALHSSKALYKNLIETISAVAWEYDLASLKFTYVSPQIEELSGYPPEKWTDFDFWASRIHPEDRDECIAYCIAETDKGLDHSIEYRMIAADESIVWVRDAVSVIKKNNKPVFLRGYFLDITDRKQTEKALQRAQKMDAIDQLTGGIAHDFNNILGIVLGNVNLLERQEELSDKTRQRIATIRKSAQRAVRLTKQLLSFSSRQTSQTIVTNINLQINEMESLITHSVTPQIEVEYELRGDLWRSQIDPGDFSDAVLNLILNARDAMPNGGKITIETRNTTLDSMFMPDIKPGEYVELVVSDNGSGMAVEHQERVFEPFFTTKPQGKGTGLGLSMVFGFVSRSGGTIKLYSDLGVGSTFRIYLPRAHGEAKPDDTSDPRQTRLPSGKETILAVDDEEALLELVCESLCSLGYRVLTAGNARQALDVLQSEPDIDLLLSDVVMPGGMNGFELAVQATEQWPALKVLLTSGYTEMSVADNGQARFKSQLLTKPYSLTELAERVQGLLNENIAELPSARDLTDAVEL